MTGTRGKKPTRGSSRGKGKKLLREEVVESEEEAQPMSEASSPPSDASDSEVIAPTQPTQQDSQASQATPAAATTTPATTKRVPVRITPTQEEQAVDYIKKHSVLYDKGDKEYRDVVKRDALWERLVDRISTQEFTLTVAHIKKWFESQRTIYGRTTKTASGSAPSELSARKQWVKDSFNFLSGHISRQKKQGNNH